MWFAKRMIHMKFKKNNTHKKKKKKKKKKNLNFSKK